MPIYEYRCNQCGNATSVTYDIATYEVMKNRPPLCACQIPGGHPMVRVFSFAIKPTMVEHLNHTTGQVVSSERQFRDQLKRQSEEATIRTGIEHNFVPVDRQDKETLGVTAEGLDATYNRRKQLGMAIPDAIKPGNLG